MGNVLQNTGGNTLKVLAGGGFGSVGDVVASAALFTDDFSSGDISNSNDYFRWGGDGALQGAGTGAGMMTTLAGPDGPNVTALTFTYGTWQEVRFHLTESISDVRGQYTLSNTSYNEVWISYDMKVPANYKHNSSGGAAGHNNKGFLTLWKGLYDGDSEAFSLFTYWPAVQRAGDVDKSMLSMTPSGSLYGVSDYDPLHKVADRGSYPGEDSVYAFIPSDYGQWRNYKMRLFAGANNTADGVAEIYKDNVLMARYTGINFQDYGNPLNGDVGFDRGYLLGYHNSGYDESTVFYITNFKFGTTEGAVS